MNRTPVQALVERLFFDHADPIVVATQATSIRIPEDVLAYTQVLGERAGITRSSMLNHCMRLGLDMVLDELPDDIRFRVEADIASRFSTGEDEGDIADLFGNNQEGN